MWYTWAPAGFCPESGKQGDLIKLSRGLGDKCFLVGSRGGAPVGLEAKPPEADNIF